MGSGTRFSWKCSGQCYNGFLPFSPVSLTELCSLILVWFERSLHSAQVSRQSYLWLLKRMTSQAVERTWIRMGGYGRLRGKCVKDEIIIIINWQTEQQQPQQQNFKKWLLTVESLPTIYVTINTACFQQSYNLRQINSYQSSLIQLANLPQWSLNKKLLSYL